jgi:hypothetical protein
LFVVRDRSSGRIEANNCSTRRAFNHENRRGPYVNVKLFTQSLRTIIFPYVTHFRSPSVR